MTSLMTTRAIIDRVVGTVPGTTPYPWPYDGDLSPGRWALVIAGWSAEWWRRSHAPGIAARVVQALAAIAPLTVVIDHPTPSTLPRLAAHRGTLAHGGSSTHDGSSTHGGSGGPPVVPDAVAVTCAGVDGFMGSALDGVLRAAGRDHLLIGGCGLEGPVHSTLRSANDRGYECLLVVDACAALDQANVDPAVSMVNMSGGIFGAVGLSADVVAALAVPEHPPTRSSIAQTPRRQR